MRTSGLRCFAVLGFVVLLAGCGAPVIDSTSLKSLERSITAIREPLDEQEQRHFDQSLSYLVDGASVSDAAADTEREPAILSLFQQVDGLGAEAVITKARSKRIDQVQQEISRLEQLRDESVEARKVLEKVKLSKARIYTRNKGFLEWPVIELDVVNGTTHMLKMVQLRATLLAGDRPDPWLQEDLSKLVIGGLAPKGRVTWRLEPEQQEWIQLVKPDPNLRFSLEVITLLGPGGPIARTGWTAVEKHDLEVYQATLEMIRSSGTLALTRPPLPITPPHTTETEAPDSETPQAAT